jgi:uncharacterized protein YndB with AHSA1/START domain
MADTQIIAPEGVPLLTITAEFDAPRELVFRAHVEPELLIQWLGPRGLSMTVERFEARDGGRYNYTHHDAEGNEFGFRGVFHGDPTPDAIVQTWEFDGAPGHVSLDTLTLEGREGRTLLKGISIMQSVEDRDAMVESGMEQGVREGYERLEELLERLKSDESGRERHGEAGHRAA